MGDSAPIAVKEEMGRLGRVSVVPSRAKGECCRSGTMPRAREVTA